MLDKNDYQGYLRQMEAIEASMIKVYSQCADLAAGEPLQGIFLKLVDEERRHSKMVASLKDIFI